MGFLKSFNLLNLLLLTVVVLLVQLKIIPIFQITSQIEIHSDQDETQQKDIGLKEKNAKHGPEDISAYEVISEKNLFHPERKIIIVEKEKEDPMTAMEEQEPDFVLYGTLISGDLRIAYMENKRDRPLTPSSGKKERIFHLGDHFGGYALKEIRHDSVVLAKGEESLTIKVYDPANPKRKSAAGAPGARGKNAAVRAPVRDRRLQRPAYRQPTRARVPPRTGSTATRQRFRRPPQ